MKLQTLKTTSIEHLLFKFSTNLLMGTALLKGIPIICVKHFVNGAAPKYYSRGGGPHLVRALVFIFPSVDM